MKISKDIVKHLRILLNRGREHYFGHMGIKPVANLSVCGVSVLDDILDKEDVLQKAYVLGVKMTEEI